MPAGDLLVVGRTLLLTFLQKNVVRALGVGTVLHAEVMKSDSLTLPIDGWTFFGRIHDGMKGGWIASTRVSRLLREDDPRKWLSTAHLGLTGGRSDLALLADMGAQAAGALRKAMAWALEDAPRFLPHIPKALPALVREPALCPPTIAFFSDTDAARAVEQQVKAKVRESARTGANGEPVEITEALWPSQVAEDAKTPLLATKRSLPPGWCDFRFLNAMVSRTRRDVRPRPVPGPARHSSRPTQRGQCSALRNPPRRSF